MVCIPCLLLPLSALFLVLFDYIRPFFVKLGILKPKAQPQKQSQEKETEMTDEYKAQKQKES